jgi:hypothetical protein
MSKRHGEDADDDGRLPVGKGHRHGMSAGAGAAAAGSVGAMDASADDSESWYRPEMGEFEDVYEDEEEEDHVVLRGGPDADMDSDDDGAGAAGGAGDAADESGPGEIEYRQGAEPLPNLALRDGALMHVDDGGGDGAGSATHRQVIPMDEEAVVEKRVYLPGAGLDDGQELEVDMSTYDMLHSVNVEWPCLSFDFVRDSLGEGRRKVCGVCYMRRALT